MLIKVKYESDVRRIEVDGNPPSYDELRATVRKLFAANGLPDSFVLKYLDDENDEISFSTDKELSEALNFLAGASGRSFLRLSVYAKSDKSVARSTTADATVHESVVCDGCNAPVRGIRYKCGMCHNFDFCEACEGVVAHDAQHIFVKIRNPVPPFYGCHRPLLRDPHSPPKWHKYAFGGGHHGHGPHHRGGPHHAFGGWERAAEAQPSSENAAEQQPQEQAQGWGCRRGGMSWGGRGGRCHGKWRQQQQHGEDAHYSSRFVEDVTIPDGTQLAPGTCFEKVWKMRNDGDNAWPAGTALTYVRGAAMPQSEGETPSVKLEQEVAAGETVDLKVVLKAPEQPGRAVSVFRLFSPSGGRFGHRVWVDITVLPPQPEVSEKVVEAESIPATPLEPAPISPVIAATPLVPAPIPSAIAATPLVPAPSPSPVPSPSPSPAPVTEEVEPAVAALVAMGFKDLDANRRALAKRNGDVGRAVHDLLRL